jgi:hypothetical protein
MFPEAYAEGVAFFRRHLGKTKVLVHGKENPYWRVKSGHFPPPYAGFVAGVRDAEGEYVQSDCGVAEFLRKLQDLCSSHGVDLSSGCACCGAGGVVKDTNGDVWDFSLDIRGA